jgi:hypothetical protein
VASEPLLWVRQDPAGCATAYLPHEGLMSGPMVHQIFAPNADVLRGEQAEGWHHKLLPYALFQSRAMPCLAGTCTHIIPFPRAYLGRLRVHAGRSIHATRTGPRGTFTACWWKAGLYDNPLPADTDVTCRRCLIQIRRNAR